MRDALIENLSARVDRLERANRILRRCFLAMMVGVTLIAITGAQQPRSTKRIEAEEIVVLGKDGKPRIRLRVGEDGPHMSFSPKDGPPRLYMGIGEPADVLSSGPYLNFRSDTGAACLSMGVTPDFRKGDAPFLTISDRDGRRRAFWGLEDDEPSLDFFDRKDRYRFDLSLSPQGSPSMEFMDDRGKVVVKIPPAAKGDIPQGQR